MKKIIVGGITLSLLILLGISFTFDSHKIESAKAQTDKGELQLDRSNLSKKIKEKGYINKVEEKLKGEGYSIKYFNVAIHPNKQTVTITIPNNEYKGNQTDTNITEIVNRIAKKNNFGVFSVEVVKQ